jgi:hypothetical protein
MRNYGISRERAQTLLELAERQGFHIWRAVWSILLGATEVQLGSPEKGLPLIEQGLHAYQNLTSPLVRFAPAAPSLCCAYGAASQPETGLRMLKYKPLTSEFLILKGALLLALSSNNADEAEALYEHAVASAQEVRARCSSFGLA